MRTLLLALALLAAFAAAAPVAETKPFCTAFQPACHGVACALTDERDGGWLVCIPDPNP